MDREKVIDRIKKCLALSKSPNEHEAAAALRQAQKLMTAHGIKDDEVDEVAVVSDFVDHDDYEYGTRKPLVIIAVTQLMQKAFGVHGVCERSPERKHRIRYFGTQSAVVLAAYSHSVVYRAAHGAWRRYIKLHPELRGVRNARASFVLGWCDAVASKVMALAPDAEIKKRVDRKKAEHYGYELTLAKAGSQTLYGDVHGAGAEHGASFDLNRPVGSDRRYLEKL